MTQKKVNILFMQSQTYFGADSYIHSLLMETIDRSWANVHVACNYGSGADKSASAKALESISDLYIRPTVFGVSVNWRGVREIVSDSLTTAVPTLFSLGGLVRYTRANDIDIIHCTEKPRDAFFGQLLAKLTGAKCVIHLHVKAEEWLSRTVQWAMREADAIVGVSRFVAESAVAMGYPAHKTYHLLNAIKTDRWNPQRHQGIKIRNEFDVEPDTTLLLAVSRLCYWKGHTELLKALTLVKQRTPNFRLLIVGKDDPRAHPGHGSYADELQQLATELELEEQIIFTGFRDDIPELMAACDIYTMPSFEEPFGMVFLEAMAMGKPVAALDNGGTREVVEHDHSGLLSPPQDIAALADNIITLIERPTLRQQMGESGRIRVAECFTPTRMAGEAESIYAQILARN